MSVKPEDFPQPDRSSQPARIAVIGAGAAGLEAAVYARHLGFRVLVFERDTQVAMDMRGWSHVTLFTPWGEGRTPLGEAQLKRGGHPDRPQPKPALYPTGTEFVTHYLDPLALSLRDNLHRDTRVVAVGRSYLFPDDHAGAPERRTGRRFRLLTRSPLEERVFTADYVIDASGVSHSTHWAGVGGLPALGEMGSARHIFYGIPDITGRDRIHFLGKRTLLIGDGASAATSALLLAEVQAKSPAGSVRWITKTRNDLPLSYVPTDPLPRRDHLFRKANLLVAGKHPGFEYSPLTQVEALQHSLGTGRFQVTLQEDRVTRRIAFDAVIANVGARRDVSTFERLLHPTEHGFYVIGAKGETDEFFLPDIRPQVRDVFRQITADATLDLYAQPETVAAAGMEMSIVA